MFARLPTECRHIQIENRYCPRCNRLHADVNSTINVEPFHWQAHFASTCRSLPILYLWTRHTVFRSQAILAAMRHRPTVTLATIARNQMAKTMRRNEVGGSTEATTHSEAPTRMGPHWASIRAYERSKMCGKPRGHSTACWDSHKARALSG